MTTNLPRNAAGSATPAGPAVPTDLHCGAHGAHAGGGSTPSQPPPALVPDGRHDPLPNRGLVLTTRGWIKVLCAQAEPFDWSVKP